ncbi:uncharacterized protein LOC141858482 [Brevipalpus obovatus]|uniref:uncharacterized protein LOC141858482 n=1 Tax=Brevipalpus obovatus TaxID=246614 RepID=UPI003D9F9051
MINISVQKIHDGYCVNVNRESEDFSIEKVSVEGEFCPTQETKSSQCSEKEVSDLLGDVEYDGDLICLDTSPQELEDKSSVNAAPNQEPREESDLEVIKEDITLLENITCCSNQPVKDFLKNGQIKESNHNTTAVETKSNPTREGKPRPSKTISSFRNSYKFLNRPKVITETYLSARKSPSQIQSNGRSEALVDEAFTINSFVENLTEGETLDIEIFDPLDPSQFQYLVRFDNLKIVGMSKEFRREITKRNPKKCPRVKLGNLIYTLSNDEKFYRARVARILKDASLRVIMLDTGLIEDVSEWYLLDGYSCKVPLLSAMVRSIENVSENVKNLVSTKICELKETLSVGVTVVSVTKSRVLVDAFIGDSGKFSLFLLPPRLFAYDSLISWEQKLKVKGEHEKSENFDVKKEKEALQENNNNNNNNNNDNKAKKNKKIKNSIENNVPVKEDLSYDSRPELSKILRSTLTYEKLPPNKGVVTYQEPSHPSVIYILGNGEKTLEVFDKSIEARPFLAEFENPQVGSLALMEKDDDEKLDFLRVAVQAILPDQNYSVFCIDFGMNDIVSSSKLLALPKVIGIEKIPAQGVKCIVDNFHKIPDFNRLIDKVFKDLALISYKTLVYHGEGTYRIEFTGLVDDDGKPYEDWSS